MTARTRNTRICSEERVNERREAELWARTIGAPSMSRRRIIGISHHSFRSQKNRNSADAMPNRRAIPLNMCLISPFLSP